MADLWRETCRDGPSSGDVVVYRFDPQVDTFQVVNSRDTIAAAAAPTTGWVYNFSMVLSSFIP